MSINCQYEPFKGAFFWGDITGQAVFESQLRLAETAPRIDRIIGGTYRVEPPVIEVAEDLLTVTGRVYPQLIYAAVPPAVERGRMEATESDGETEAAEGYPREYDALWADDTGVEYRTQLSIASLRPDMRVEVEAIPEECIFEKENGEKVSFQGSLTMLVHIAHNQTVPVISEVVPDKPEHYNISKECLTVEELGPTYIGTLPLQKSLFLPGIKPGMARILRSQVQPVGIHYETGRGKVVLRGQLGIDLVYIGCDDEGRPTEVFVNQWSPETESGLPFEIHLQCELPPDQVVVIPRVTVRHLKLEVRSQRELVVQAELVGEARISRIATREIVADVSAAPGGMVDLQKYQLNYEEYLGEADGEIDFDLPLELPSGAVAERILACQGSLGGFKLEAAEGQASLEGSLDLTILQASSASDNSQVTMHHWGKINNSSLPVSGMVEFSRLVPEALLRAELALESLKVEIGADQSLRAVGVIRIRVFARIPRAQFVLRDCAEVLPVDPETRPSMLFYIVQPGDTLWKIARHYQSTVDILARANQIANPELIDIGQKLLIPKPETLPGTAG